jgi:hypothetical protein
MILSSWQTILLDLLRTFTQILTAGIAITAFSLLVNTLTFNLRNRVARSFMLILICVVTVFTADALGSNATDTIDVEFWLRLQWLGILFLPAAYLHFSDALLETTGRPSRGRRRWAVRLCYLISTLFLIGLPFNIFVGQVVLNLGPAPYLQPTPLTAIFVLYYLGTMIVSWINFGRAYRRTTNLTSRRRMVYLITGAAAPALGSFPFLLFDSGFASLHPLIFWLMAFLSNMLVGVLLVVMAYAIAFFGVSWTDRVIKARMFKWLMRGPIVASITLGLATLVRRTGEAFGVSYTAFVPIITVASILLLEHMITLFAPLAERFLFDGSDRAELELLRELEDRLLTTNDLHQFLEMILAAVRDRLQAPGAYVIALNGEGVEVIVKTGGADLDPSEDEQMVECAEAAANQMVSYVRWQESFLIPLVTDGLEHRMVGILGVSGMGQINPDEEAIQSLSVLARRAALALRDRQIQQQVFQTLIDLMPQMGLIQSLRAAGRYNETRLSQEELPMPESDLAHWVKEALTHYWGGPKLTESPLIQLQIVQEQSVEMEGNTANALRAILKDAIDRIKPEGERKYTSEWTLYNILEMKFMEGRKVREIALRLAMSEADLYRKQRVAIDAVAKVVMEMEIAVRKEK